MYLKIKQKANIKIVFSISLIALLFSFSLPENWIPFGGESGKYEMSIDIDSGIEGKNAATIKSKNLKYRENEFGTLSQICSASKFAGKRIKLSGLVKTKNATKASLWLRADNTCTGEIMAFDNMDDRVISGTSDWKNCEIVLYIPTNANRLIYGGMLRGIGQMWFDDLKFELVADSVRQTGSIIKESENIKPLLHEPINLDFEK